MTAVAVEPSVALAPPRSPYRGLTPFGDSELDALLFFGRRYESDVIAENLVASPLTVLYGPSGVGKSSVLRAGVARALREWAEPGSTEAEVAFVAAWAGSPLAELVGAPVEQGSLPDAVASWAARRSGETYLVLDQFEEFFLYHDAVEAAEFAEALAELRHSRVNVLISIREDALAKLDVFKGRLPALFANVLRLDRLDRAAAREAIVRPVETYNLLVEPDDRVTIEPALVAAVLGEVALGRLDVGPGGRGRSALEAEGDRVEAPFLQLVMERLWDEERRSRSRLLRLGTLERLGGAERIVREHVESALAALSAPEQDWASRLFNQLVTPSGTKIAHDASDLARYAGARENEVAPVLDELTRARVLRPVATDEEGGGSYEIFHDVLAGPVLAWHAQHESERALAEERARARRRNRRAVGVAALAVIGLLLMTGVAVYALNQRSEAQRQAEITRVKRQEALDQAVKARAAETRANDQRDIARAAKIRAKKAEKVAKAKAKEASRQRRQADSAKKKAQAYSVYADGQRRRAIAAGESEKRAAGDADDARRRAVIDKRRAESSAADAKRAARLAKRAGAREHRAKVDATQSAKIASHQKQKALVAKSRALDEAQRAQAHELASKAALKISEDPVESIEMALDALQKAPDATVADVLRDALDALNVRRIFRAGEGGAAAPRARRFFQAGDGGAVLEACFSPDGKLAVTSSSGGLVRVLSIPDGRLVWAVPTGSRLSAGASFSPDGKTIATPGADGAVRLWDLQSKKLLRTLPGDRAAVTSATFSHGGGLVAAMSDDGTLRIWDAASGAPLGRYPSRQPTGLPGVAPQAVFSAGDRWVATGGIDRFVRVYDVRAGTLAWSRDQVGRVNRVAFALSGDRLATGGADNLVRTWDASTGLLLRTMRGHGWQVTDVEFSPDGRSLVSASLDWTVRVWDAETGASVSTGPAHDQRVRRASFSPNGRRVVTASEDRRAFVFEASSGTLLTRLTGHDETVNDAVFSPNGRFVLTSSNDGEARLWDPRREPELRPISRQKGRIASVAFSPDGQTVASASADGTVHLWRIGEGAVATLRHGRSVNGADFSRDGSLLLTSSADGTARLWRPPSTTPVRQFPHGAPVRAAALSRDARLVATAGSDGTVRLWSAATGRLLRVIPFAPGFPVTRVAFSPDGRLLAAGGARGAVRVYGVSGGRRLRYSKLASLKSGAIVSLSFSPDGRQLLAAAANDVNAHVWNARTGRHEFDLEGHTRPLTSASFNRRGKLIVTTSTDDDGRLWNAANGALVKLLRAHNSAVSAAAFSADGRWVVTAGPGNAGIWSVAAGSGGPLAMPEGPEILLAAAAFSPRGWRIVTGSTAGAIETYNCVLCGGARELKSIARSRLAELGPR